MDACALHSLRVNVQAGECVRERVHVRAGAVERSDRTQAVFRRF